MTDVTVTVPETVTASDNMVVAGAKHAWNGVKAIFGGDGATNKQLIGAAFSVGVASYLVGTNLAHNAVLSGKRAVKVGGVVITHRQ